MIADGNAVVRGQVTFWSPRWSKLNVPSGGPAPAAFKGFEDNPLTAPVCDTAWSTFPGSSTAPSDGLPRYLAVIVSSSHSQSGSVISGNVTNVVIVRTDAGHPGTGEVVAQIC